MSDEKSFSVCQEMLPLFRAVLLTTDVLNFCLHIKCGENSYGKDAFESFQAFSRAIGNSRGGQSYWPFR